MLAATDLKIRKTLLLTVILIKKRSRLSKTTIAQQFWNSAATKCINKSSKAITLRTIIVNCFWDCYRIHRKLSAMMLCLNSLLLLYLLSFEIVELGRCEYEVSDAQKFLLLLRTVFASRLAILFFNIFQSS